MAIKVNILTSAYSGYLQKEPKEDEVLTHVEIEDPCGEYLRRFWQPAVFLYELKDRPVRLRLFGEDLVAFRDHGGQIGILKLHCSHRGCSLEFGQIAEKGLRCCYHGWLFDVDGKILETPGEAPDSKLKDRLYHGAYPIHVYQGLIFVYMGPPEKMPPFPVYDTFEMPRHRPSIGMRHMLPCNWLQIKENCMDPAHLSFLHTLEGNVGFPKELSIKSNLEFMETPIGMIYIDTRRIDDNVWVRMCDFICPNIHQYGFQIDPKKEGSHVRPYMTQWSVPIDNTHTMNFRVRHVKESEKTDPSLLAYGQTEGPYQERQMVPGDYDAQTSQRPIAIHALENLGSTDRGISMLRRLIRQGIRAAQQGTEIKGLAHNANGPIRTYASATVVRAPKASTLEADRELVQQTGRKLAKELLEKL
jgi:nitrite reductase/ring-hydroxylating ferredoxin subunit